MSKRKRDLIKHYSERHVLNNETRQNNRLNKAKLGAKFEAKLRTIEKDSLRVATDLPTQNRFTPGT